MYKFMKTKRAVFVDSSCVIASLFHFQSDRYLLGTFYPSDRRFCASMSTSLRSWEFPHWGKSGYWPMWWGRIREVLLQGTWHTWRRLSSSKLDPWSQPMMVFKMMHKGYTVPEVDHWRLTLLEKLLNQRREMVTCDKEVEDITGLIDSLCSS